MKVSTLSIWNTKVAKLKIAWQSSHGCAEQSRNSCQFTRSGCCTCCSSCSSCSTFQAFRCLPHTAWTGYLFCYSVDCFVHLRDNISILMQRKAACEEQRDVYWNYDTCACEKRGVVARGAGEEPRTNSNCGEYARWASGAHRVAR